MNWRESNDLRPPTSELILSTFQRPPTDSLKILLVENVHESVAELRQVHAVDGHGPWLSEGVHLEALRRPPSTELGAVDPRVFIVV